MKLTIKKLLLALILMGMVVFIGCENNKGFFETTGEKLDVAVEKTGDTTKDVVDATGKTLKKATKATGETLKGAADKTGDKLKGD